MATLLTERNATRREVDEPARTLALRQTQITQLGTSMVALRHEIDQQDAAVESLKAEADTQQQMASPALAQHIGTGKPWKCRLPGGRKKPCRRGGE